MNKREDGHPANETMRSKGAVSAVEMLEALKTKGAVALFPNKAVAASRQKQVGGRK